MTPGRIKFLIALGSAIRNGAVKTIKQAMNFAEQQFGKIDKSFVDDIVNVFKKEGKIKKKGEVVPIKKQEGIVRRPEEFATRKEYERYLDETLGPGDDVFGSPMKDDLLKEWDKVNAKNVTPKEKFIPIRKDQIDDIESAIKADEGIMATDEAAEIVKKRTDDIVKGDVTGETSDLMKDLEGRLKKIQEYAKKMDNPMGDLKSFVIKDPFRPGGPLDPKIAIVRTAAREILHQNQKAGKLKILDKKVANNIEKYIPSGEDPITTLRKYYGEAGLEALDAHADKLLNAQGYGEINAILTKNKLFDLTPKKVPGYDQSIVTAEKIRKAKEQEAKNRKILEEFDPPDRTENAHGGLIDILKL